jgi:hypothetical protein
LTVVHTARRVLFGFLVACTDFHDRPPVAASVLLADAVEKGVCRNIDATLIQDREPTRNLDSKIHMPGFVRFKF